MLTYSALRDAVESGLRDSSNTHWSTGELDYNITTALRQVAKYIKHLVRITYQIESRYGSASSTSSGNLVDSTKGQFQSTDTGKKVFNDTDKTWADVIAYTDANTLGLSHDIFASGENYYLYNKGCYNNKQINVEDIVKAKDYLWIESVEYPIGIEREVDWIQDNVLQIGFDREPDDSDPSNTDRVIDVQLWVARRHKLSQLTTFTGAVNNGSGYNKGDTTMAIDGLTASEAIEVDQEFTLANRPQIYTITTGVTLDGTGAGSITFYPGLDADVADDVVITMVQSTLSRIAEEMVIEYVIAKALFDEAGTHLPLISQGGTGAYRRFIESAKVRYDDVKKDLRGVAESKPAKTLSRL